MPISSQDSRTASEQYLREFDVSSAGDLVNQGARLFAQLPHGAAPNEVFDLNYLRSVKNGVGAIVGSRGGDAVNAGKDLVRKGRTVLSALPSKLKKAHAAVMVAAGNRNFQRAVQLASR